MLETIHLPHLPPTLPLYITLYHSLQNATFLRQQLLAGNAEYEYAFVDAKMIISRRHLLAACFRALNDHLNGRLKSRNVHSEIVFALSGNNNIGEAFQKFGLQDSTTTLLVVRVGVDPAQTSREAVHRHLQEVIRGTEGQFDDETLAEVCDVGRVRKAYKVAASVVAAKGKGNEKRGGVGDVDGEIAAGEERASGLVEREEERERERERERLERAVLGAMALRGAT